MWLTLTALLLGAAQGQDQAKEVYNRMEAQIQKSKTLQLQIDIAIAPGKESHLKGNLMVAKDNRVKMDINGTFAGKPVKIAIVSDGAQMSVNGFGPKATVMPTPKDLREKVLASVTRNGIFKSYFSFGSGHTVSDFKLGKKEMIAGKEAQAVEYKETSKVKGGLGVGAREETILVTVWIDVKTHLPLKRLVTFKEGQDSFTITETYTNAILDAAIDADRFALPK